MTDDASGEVRGSVRVFRDPLQRSGAGHPQDGGVPVTARAPGLDADVVLSEIDGGGRG